MQISRDYDVLIEEQGISLRGLFIIDPKGVVRYAGGIHFCVRCPFNVVPGRSRSTTCQLVVLSMKPSVCCRRSSLRFVFGVSLCGIVRHRALQDKHGEVCPAGWTEGSKTMKADPKESLHYFAAVDADVEMQAGASKKRARKD